MSEPIQNRFGPLRSSMELTLHTYHAVRVWHGRPAGEKKAAITGMASFVSLVNRMKHEAQLDDPYADFWLIRIQEKLASSKAELARLQEKMDPFLTQLLAARCVGDNHNVQPVTLPIFISSPFGFLAVYLLITYDDSVRRLQQAYCAALITRRDMESWINAGGRVLRSLFGLAQQYKFSGVTRADFAVNNDRARQARETFGELPLDVLEGVRRSEFAPPIIRHRGRDDARGVVEGRE
ncbi:TIGR03761 family integrating conjugative element protein [Pseudomonas gingeri]|uniref:TIGR03761 family integrating conjugative element protein n=1 Tax=Pseudomonas gingeri TaxID=117681 RepID=A0A7Y7XH59_9PSED|nr:TIGR03761 family integrating conjugative element protein [Pseudomonas gingeri]NWB99596.1 TIGR03761 family integrating conjugative element protein [Pseudomonas gingeri]